MDRKSQDDKERICFDVFRQEIMKLGFCEEAAMNITNRLFSSMDGIYQFEHDGFIGFGDSKEDAALRQLKAANANWKLAENSILSKEYWERYFAQHPEQRPKHLIFYDGDPTSAIHKLQQGNNIGRADVSTDEGKLLGFDDRHITDIREDPRAKVGYDELVETAHRIITEHYSGGGK